MIQRGNPRKIWLFLLLQREFFGEKMGKIEVGAGKVAPIPKTAGMEWWLHLSQAKFPQNSPKIPKFSFKKIPNNQIFAASPKAEGIFHKNGEFLGLKVPKKKKKGTKRRQIPTDKNRNYGTSEVKKIPKNIHPQERIPRKYQHSESKFFLRVFFSVVLKLKKATKILRKNQRKRQIRNSNHRELGSHPFVPKTGNVLEFLGPKIGNILEFLGRVWISKNWEFPLIFGTKPREHP